MTTDSHTEQTAHEVHPHGGHDDEHHWSDLQYIKLALALAVITALEVALSYTKDDFGKLFLPLLLIMMAIKFFAVVLYFMHLKFDNPLFRRVFFFGLILAVVVFLIMLSTFEFWNGDFYRHFRFP